MKKILLQVSENNVSAINLENIKVKKKVGKGGEAIIDAPIYFPFKRIL